MHATSPPPVPPDAASTRARDRVLRAARELFYRFGIRAVGVDEIVRNAGVTKPSLYRNFPSKDELAACYLRAYDQEFWSRLEAARELYPEDSRAQILHYLQGLAERASVTGYRGCGLSNAGIEYPEADHPARRVAQKNKQAFRAKLRTLARDMGARQPDLLGDALLLLIEGSFSSGQLFGPGGPAMAVVETAEQLIAHQLAPATEAE